MLMFFPHVMLLFYSCSFHFWLCSLRTLHVACTHIYHHKWFAEQHFCHLNFSYSHVQIWAKKSASWLITLARTGSSSWGPWGFKSPSWRCVWSPSHATSGNRCTWLSLNGGKTAGRQAAAPRRPIYSLLWRKLGGMICIILLAVVHSEGQRQPRQENSLWDLLLWHFMEHRPASSPSFFLSSEGNSA